MNKEEVLNDFLKSLRIAINNASSYSGTHPYFIDSVEKFKKNADLVFGFLNPIKIGVTPNSLFLDSRYWQKMGFCVELAMIFHRRKLRSIQIEQGATVEELRYFLAGLALPVREVFKQGGLGGILKKENIAHVSIEELDYSQFLKDEGEEIRDVWEYLVAQAIGSGDSEKVSVFADNFEKIALRFKADDLLNDEELRQSVTAFLDYLKKHDQERFRTCISAMFRSVLRHKDVLGGENIDKIKVFFRHLSEEDFAGALWSGILKDENFDNLSLELFSRFTDEKMQEGIASLFLTDSFNKDSLKQNPKAIKKIQELLAQPNASLDSEVYRGRISAMLNDISSGGAFSFDRGILQKNYRLILLSMFAQEENSEKAEQIIEKISQELPEIVKVKDYQYLKYLCGALKDGRKQKPYLSRFLDVLDTRVTKIIENLFWEPAEPLSSDLRLRQGEAEPLSSDLEYFADTLEKSSMGVEFYLDKIFNEGKVSAYALKLFFKFFPGHKDIFYGNLEKKNTDVGFMLGIIDGLKTVDLALAIEALKNIFSFSNEFIKIEVLKAMQKLSAIDEKFTILSLEKGTPLLKRQALEALSKSEGARKEAVELLFSVKENNALLENMSLIEEVCFKEASPYLTLLSKKRFFWNKQIREKAKDILEKIK